MPVPADRNAIEFYAFRVELLDETTADIFVTWRIPTTGGYAFVTVKAYEAVDITTLGPVDFTTLTAVSETPITDAGYTLTGTWKSVPVPP